MDEAIVDHEAVAGSAVTAVLVHPHPDMGGDRFNHVIDAVYRALPSAGVSAARFDLSSSDTQRARAETLAAVDVVGAPRAVLVGYSFGADVALGVDDQRLAGWFTVAAPLRMNGMAGVAGDPRPKALLVPEHDQFSPPARVRERTAGWVNATVTELSGADHFLHGRGRAVADAVVAWVTELVSPPI